MAQLTALAPGGGDGAAGKGRVDVEVWLEWLLGAYADSKRNAATLFEALYDRFVLPICIGSVGPVDFVLVCSVSFCGVALKK